MDHFELELKESIVPGVREETEKRDKTIHDEILPLKLWGRKWNLIIHGITGEIRESSDVTRRKVHEFFNAVLRVNPDEVKHIIIAACHRIRGSRDAAKERKSQSLLRLLTYNNATI